jgi:hypothetical protein
MRRKAAVGSQALGPRMRARAAVAKLDRVLSGRQYPQLRSLPRPLLAGEAEGWPRSRRKLGRSALTRKTEPPAPATLSLRCECGEGRHADCRTRPVRVQIRLQEWLQDSGPVDPRALPRPWIPPAVNPRRGNGDAWLDEAADWLNDHYAGNPKKMIAPCWPCRDGIDVVLREVTLYRQYPAEPGNVDAECLTFG